jgi:hypothetical protein
MQPPTVQRKALTLQLATLWESTPTTLALLLFLLLRLQME